MTQRPSCPCSFSSTSGSYSQPPGPRTSLSRPAPTRVYPDLCPGLPPLTPFGPSPRVTALPPPGRAPALGTCRASRPRPPPWDAPPIASAYANQAAPPPPLPARQEAPRRPASAPHLAAPAPACRAAPAPSRAAAGPAPPAPAPPRPRSALAPPAGGVRRGRRTARLNRAGRSVRGAAAAGASPPRRPRPALLGGSEGTARPPDSLAPRGERARAAAWPAGAAARAPFLRQPCPRRRHPNALPAGAEEPRRGLRARSEVIGAPPAETDEGARPLSVRGAVPCAGRALIGQRWWGGPRGWGPAVTGLRLAPPGPAAACGAGAGRGRWRSGGVF